MLFIIKLKKDYTLHLYEITYIMQLIMCKYKFVINRQFTTFKMYS